MMKKLILILFVIWHTILFAGNELTPIGAHTMGMGYTNALNTSSFSAINNPAIIGLTPGISAGVFAQRSYMMNDLNMLALAFSYTANFGGIGIGITQFGDRVYNESRIHFNYSKLIAKKISIAVGPVLMRTSVAEEGAAMAVTAQVGIYYHIFSKLITAVHLYNPFPISLQNEKVPSQFTFGLGYIPSQKAKLIVEVMKSTQQPLHLRTGIEYTPIKFLSLRTGFDSSPGTYTFGLGINLSTLKIDLATSIHQSLGLSPGIDIVYNFTKEKK